MDGCTFLVSMLGLPGNLLTGIWCFISCFSKRCMPIFVALDVPLSAELHAEEMHTPLEAEEKTA